MRSAAPQRPFHVSEPSSCQLKPQRLSDLEPTTPRAHSESETTAFCLESYKETSQEVKTRTPDKSSGNRLKMSLTSI